MNNIEYSFYKPKDEDELKKLIIFWKKYCQNTFFSDYPNLSKYAWNINIIYKFAITKYKFQNSDFIFIFENKEVPKMIGIILMIKNFKCLCDTNRDIDNFLWYVLKLKNTKKGIFNLFLKEYAIINNNTKYLWLHADPNGKEKLLNFYLKSGFSKCECNMNEKVSKLRKNDGRYLYYTFK